MYWSVLQASEELHFDCTLCGEIVTSGDFFSPANMEDEQAEWVKRIWGMKDAYADFGVCERCIGERPCMSCRDGIVTADGADEWLEQKVEDYKEGRKIMKGDMCRPTLQPATEGENMMNDEYDRDDYGEELIDALESAGARFERGSDGSVIIPNDETIDRMLHEYNLDWVWIGTLPDLAARTVGCKLHRVKDPNAKGLIKDILCTRWFVSEDKSELWLMRKAIELCRDKSVKELVQLIENEYVGEVSYLCDAYTAEYWPTDEDLW